MSKIEVLEIEVSTSRLIFRLLAYSFNKAEYLFLLLILLSESHCTLSTFDVIKAILIEFTTKENAKLRSLES